MAHEDPQPDRSSRLPEGMEVLRINLLKAQLAGIMSAGFTPAELHAAIDDIVAEQEPRSTEVKPEAQSVPEMGTASLSLATVQAVNAATFAALDQAFLGVDQSASDPSSPVLTSLVSGSTSPAFAPASAGAPAGPTPPTEAQAAPEAIESPLEADPFSREALLRINAIYHITPEADLEAFLADDEYITCHQKMAGGNNLPTGAIPIAQQLFCALPNIQQHQREVACIGICTGFHDLDTKWQAASCTKERDLLWSDKPAEEKIDFLKKGFLPETQPVFRQRFDNFQKVAILSRDNDRALPSYALLRLFRRGVLKDTFKREHFFMDGDALFARYADTDRDGRLNMVLYNEGKLMISINNEHRAGNKYELFDLSPELTALVLAECHAVCLELLPTINYLYARNGQRFGEREAISTLITQSDLSGLRLNSSGEIESTAKNGEATITSTGATQLGHQWYARGRSDLAESIAEAERRDQINKLHNKIFGCRPRSQDQESYVNYCVFGDMLVAISHPEASPRPAILPFLRTLKEYLEQCAQASPLPPLPEKAAWLTLKTKLEMSDAYQNLTKQIISVKTWRDIEDKPQSWPKEWLRPSRRLYDEGVARSLHDLEVAKTKFDREFLFADPELGPYFTRIEFHPDDKLKIDTLSHRSWKFPEEVEINADTDLNILAGQIMRAARKQYEKTYADWQTGLKNLLKAYDRSLAELAEAETAGVEIDDSQKRSAQLPPDLYNSLRQQAGLETATS